MVVIFRWLTARTPFVNPTPMTAPTMACEVETGTRMFGSVEVLDGIEAGERVVSEGIVKLRDGVRVRLAEPGFEIGDPRAGTGG